MSTRITNERLHELIGGAAGPISADEEFAFTRAVRLDTHTALTELLSLRAEVERLRAVEQAARYAVADMTGVGCCINCGWIRGHSSACMLGKIHAALDANEGSKP